LPLLDFEVVRSFDVSKEEVRIEDARKKIIDIVDFSFKKPILILNKV
jgi:hypothetical protein